MKPGSSKRALYMVVGSLITLLVLGAAAFQLPRYFGAEADEAHPVAQVEALPEQQPPASALDTANSGSVAQDPVERTAPRVPSGTPAQQQAQAAEGRLAASKPSSGSPGQVISSRAAQPSSPTAPPAVQVTQTVPGQNQNPPVDQPAVQAPAPKVNAAELEELAGRFNLMATRANTIRSSLKRLEESQARMGLGLRGDVTTAASRMEMFMDQAESALKGANAAGSKKAMDAAERELERIEKVLEGR